MSIYSKIIDLQKLGIAWDNVRKNKPAAGADHVTYGQFELNRMEELKQLNMELKEYRYEVIPVRTTTIYKGEKAREIALYSMRDKVVQQSITSELIKIYDAKFSKQTFAYRPNKSALSAVELIDKEIKKGNVKYILKIDIHKFFDSIDWNTLKRMLKASIPELDVLKLIEMNVLARSVDENGELKEKSAGIYQGSSLAPILSNIYMMAFDRWLEAKNLFFIRYSDDIIILGQDKNELVILLNSIKLNLGKLKLTISEKKTVLASVEDGVDYLGYHFSSKGKAIPTKAEQSLQERLELMWLTSPEMAITDKITKAAEIIGGWEQYFRENREYNSIFEYVTLVAMCRNKEAYLQQLKSKRKYIENIYYDITKYLAQFWQQVEEPVLELFEYEQFYQIHELGKSSKNSKDTDISNRTSNENDDKWLKSYVGELLINYRKLMINKDVEIMLEIMQIYTDHGEYEKASYWMKKSQNEDDYSDNSKASSYHLENNISLSSNYNATAGLSEVERYEMENHLRNQMNINVARSVLKLFVGREDIYSKESMNYGRKRQSDLELFPITDQLLLEHMQGHQTLGTAVQRANSTVRFIVLDIDISKQILLQYDRNSEEGKTYMKKAYTFSKLVIKVLKKLGIYGYIEYSGCRGYHIWILSREWMPVRYANMLCEVIAQKILELNEDTDGITVEYFPNKTRVKEGKYGQILKLPFGNHVRTGEMSYFIGEQDQIITDIGGFLDNLALTSLSEIKKVLAVNSGIKESQDRKEIPFDKNAYGDVCDNVSKVIENCSLMRYLCHKAINTGYLTHYERMSILYVFGHLGDDGKEFVHTVMSHTLNYQYNTTERFVNKLPGKPISCVKLRDQYKQITAEYGCNCSFKRTKNCYPSPVLHAISSSKDVEESVTLPTSRTVTKEKQKEVIEEINIHKKAQELATKIVEHKKQKRKIDQSIIKVEKELGHIFDNACVDCLEIEMGMLVRRRKDNGVEWLIEL